MNTTDAGNESEIAGLRSSLKAAGSRKSEQKRRIAELQAMVASLARDKAGLQARIGALSPEALQRGVAAGKTAIDEKDFRILELEDEVSGCDRDAKVLEDKIDTLRQRIKCLEDRLR